jgi:hypothetical protein
MITTPTLSISPEKVCFIIVKAREFDVKDIVTEPDPASSPTDDGMVSVLEDHSDDPIAQELRSFINALTEDEQIDLVALTWLGRGRCHHRGLGSVAVGGYAPAQCTDGRISPRQADACRSLGGRTLAVRLLVRRVRKGPLVTKRTVGAR